MSFFKRLFSCSRKRKNSAASIGRVEFLESRRMLTVLGDSNGDGLFDTADLVAVFQAGKYNTGETATFEQGDWNSDGFFDTGDLVAAFQGGHFEKTPTAETQIQLNGNSIEVSGNGAEVSGSTVTIGSSGTYVISGTLDDGQIVVDTQDQDPVTLVLSGVNIASSNNAAIYVANAEDTVITLAEGTENIVSDGVEYELGEDDEPDAAIFSHDDLVINGTGTLRVTGNFADGIVSKDDLDISGGTIVVNAVDDGVRGRDSVEIDGGNISVTAGGDGIKSNNDEDEGEGTISISSGSLSIVSGDDGIQAVTKVTVSGGTISVKSGGGANSNSGSGHGINADIDIAIEGGEIEVDAAGDAVHADGNIAVTNGTLNLATADDAIHADTSIVINGGTIDISKSYEGIESTSITINDGTIHLVSSDDGINAGEGTEFGGPGGGGPGGGTEGNGVVTINGGYIAVNAAGDGVDVNGSMTMTGGTLIVHGPTANNNGALDYDNSFVMTGGFLVAVGSSRMAQAPGSASTQESLSLSYQSVQAANTLVHIESADGVDILTFAPQKAYQSVVVSSPLLTSGTSYLVYSGGSYSGAMTDGLYVGGEYTPGTLAGTVTVS